MPLYFAYGSNLSSERLRDRLGNVGIVGVATLANYRHCFDKRGQDGTAKGNIIGAAGAQVMGVLYQIDEPQLAQLRGYEGGYRQIALSVSHGPELTSAVSFEALVRASGLKPSAEYIQHYQRGMREHDFPAAYCLELLGAY